MFDLISYPRSVLFDICPILVELHNIQVLKLDQIVKHCLDFFLQKNMHLSHVNINLSHHEFITYLQVQHIIINKSGVVTVLNILLYVSNLSQMIINQ